jgi:CHAD domain-containing protein
MEDINFTSEECVAEAGRSIMAGLLTVMMAHDARVRVDADTIAVHEMRKSIRRTFTCFRLFDPFFEPGVLQTYRRSLRRIMRRLGRSRDLAVFRMNLAAFNDANQGQFDDLVAHFAGKQEAVDRKLIRYLEKHKLRAFFASYVAFTESRGLHVCADDGQALQPKIGHFIPIMVFERIAAVRAFEDVVAHASLKQLHRLRIQFKELRYTLQFFASLLGNVTPSILLDLNSLQDVLGHLNDTTVALEFLESLPGHEASATRCRRLQFEEQERLLQAFGPAWEQFNTPQWRQAVATAVASV